MAGVVNMVPEGLVLLTSTALAVGIVRLGKRRVLVGELGALEGLARVDVLCVDKTGTLTDGQPELVAVEPLTDGIDVDLAVAGFAASDPDPNASLQAILRARTGAAWPVEWRVAFSSAQRWSAIGVGEGAWALGAPDVLFDWVAPSYADVMPYAASGCGCMSRPAGVCCSSVGIRARAPTTARTDEFKPVAVVALGEQVRPDVPTTVDWFAEQGVMLKVLSGDEPTTVAAIAGAVGIDGARQPTECTRAPRRGLPVRRGGPGRQRLRAGRARREARHHLVAAAAGPHGRHGR